MKDHLDDEALIAKGAKRIEDRRRWPNKYNDLLDDDRTQREKERRAIQDNPDDPKNDIINNWENGFGPKRSRNLADLKNHPTTPTGLGAIGTATPNYEPEKKTWTDVLLAKRTFPPSENYFSNGKRSATTPRSLERGRTPFNCTEGWISSTNANPHSGAPPSQGSIPPEKGAATSTPSGPSPRKTFVPHNSPKPF